MKLDAVPFRWLFAFALLLALAACGGGGGGASGPIRTISPGDTLQGNWQRTITFDGNASTPTAIAAADVPSETEAGGFTTATVAQLEVARFPGKTVAVNGSTVTVTDPDTNFTVQVNTLSVSNYTGCGTCAVGTAVTFTVTANVTESGTLDGAVLATPVIRNTVLTLRYERIS